MARPARGNRWILNLSDLFTDDLRSDFVDATVQSVTYQGKIWGVLWFTDVGLLWYRKASARIVGSRRHQDLGRAERDGQEDQ
jgi:ABC-type glycerol-3-phosphate transport system substrate-binding protein